MPQINDYSAPETQGQGPVGGISPNLEAVSAPGRAMQNLGQEAMQLSDTFHRRDVAKETADVYSTFAQLRADKTQELEQRATDPNFDTEKFQQEYADQINELSNQYNTGEGKDFFTKQAARLGGALLTRASKIQMQIAGDQAKVQLDGALKTDTTTLTRDPSQFPDVVDAGQEFVHAQVAANPKLAVHEASLKEYMAEQQAVAALKGWQNQDPGSIQDERDGKGKQMYDSGEFDKYLKPKARENLESYFRQTAHAADADQMRSKKADEQADKDYYQQVGNQFFGKLQNNQLTANDVMNLKGRDGGDAPFQEKQFWIKQIEEHAKEPFKGNQLMYNDILSRIQADDDDPRKIKDPVEVRNMVRQNGISITQYHQLLGFMNTDPEVAAQTAARRNLLNAGKAAIYRPSMTGTGKDVTSVEKYNLFSQDIMAAEKAQRAANKPIGDVYDPKSSAYVDPKSERYQTSMQEMQENVKRQMQTAIGTGGKKDPNARQPKESPADYLKRTSK